MRLGWGRAMTKRVLEPREVGFNDTDEYAIAASVDQSEVDVIKDLTLAGNSANLIERMLTQCRRVLSGFVVVLLAIMSVLIVYQVACRYIFASPSNVSDELLRFSLIWMGILGAVVCFLNNTHLSLPIVLDRLSPVHRAQAHVFNHIMSIALGFVIGIGGWIAIEKNFEITSAMLGWSIGIHAKRASNCRGIDCSGSNLQVDTFS